MRARSSLLLALFLIVSTAPVLVPSIAHAQEEEPIQEGEDSQDIVEDEEESTSEESDTEGDGQSDPDAETGAGEEEQAGDEAAAEEEDPQWTYQMARITLALLFLLILGVGVMYYRGVVVRSRAGV